MINPLAALVNGTRPQAVPSSGAPIGRLRFQSGNESPDQQTGAQADDQSERGLAKRQTCTEARDHCSEQHEKKPGCVLSCKVVHIDILPRNERIAK